LFGLWNFIFLQIFFWGKFQKSSIEEVNSYMTVTQRVNTSVFNTIKTKNNSKFTERNGFNECERENIQLGLDWNSQDYRQQQKFVDGYFQKQQQQQQQQHQSNQTFQLNNHTSNGINHFNEKNVFSEIDNDYKKLKEPEKVTNITCIFYSV
jgi:hypothetical protein